MKVNIKHTDGVTTVTADGRIEGSEVHFDYRFEGMSYGQTLSLQQCFKKGYLKKKKVKPG